MSRPISHAVALGAAAVLALATSVTFAQRNTPADIAARFSGAWKINFELSPQFAPRPGGAGGTGGRRGGTPNTPSFALGASGVRTAAPAFQRGGGGAPAQQSDADRAGMAAIRALQQVSDTLTIAATAESVTFKDARGERTYALDNKATKVDFSGATITMKSRLDKNTIKQEFVFGETRVSHDWELNNEGTRINFKMIIANLASTGMNATTEAKAVYDKQP